jgi:hypothetical protein
MALTRSRAVGALIRQERHGRRAVVADDASQLVLRLFDLSIHEGPLE